MEHILRSNNRVLSIIRNAVQTVYGNLAAIAMQMSPEWVVGLIVAGFGIWGAAHVYELGLTSVFLDQNAHLNLSRQAVDSMTPGVSQIGFWPPLLHILLMPFAAMNGLYISGLAGAFALVPILVLGGVFMYKLIYLYTEQKILSMIGAILFAVNPYMLYYAATPMMEVLFLLFRKR